MDGVIELMPNAEEPEWLESQIVGELRVWQILFLCLSGITAIIVMVCCCVRFRIPRTKQQIEADYQRCKITTKFRHELEKVQDSKMDAMSLKDALELLYTRVKDMEKDNPGSQSSSTSPQQGSLEIDGGKLEAQAVPSFAQLATKVANISKLTQPKSPSSPSPSSNIRMDF